MYWIMRFALTALLPVVMHVPAGAQEKPADNPTVYMITYVDTLPGAVPKAAALLKQLADASRKEPGLLRFDLLARTAPAGQFLLLETWKDQQSADAHAGAAPAMQVRESLKPLLLTPIDDRVSSALAVGPLPAGSPRGAVYVATHVDVGQANRDKGAELLKTFAETSRKDAGNFRLDVLVQKARFNHFTLVEAWKDQKSDDAHDLAPHTKEFRKQMLPLVGAHYDQRWYKAL